MIRLGVFDLLEPIARGGMGEVWRGRHGEQGVATAVKVIRRARDHESQLAFEREVRAHAGLNHPGVALLFDYGTIDGRAARASQGVLTEGSPYLAMEFAQGGTVRNLMPFDDWPSVHAMISSVLDALSHAHARDVIHRDLKPENMLVVGADSQQIKLSDFGIAHALGAEHDRPLQSLHSFSGTPHYIAPEQARGQWRRYGPWTDLYALGCVVWEWVCGRPPFVNDNLLKLIASHCGDERPRLDPRFAVPDELENWIHRAMQIDPEIRFRRAADAWAALPAADAIEGPAGSSPLASRIATVIPTLAATICVDSTLPFAPARTADSPDLEIAFADTIDGDPMVHRFDGPRRDSARSRAQRLLLPDTWRSKSTERLPDRLVGAGLGLFGLREIPFVDRDAARDEIWAALRQVVEEGAFRVVFIIGGPGAGKSSLAKWMACRADEVGAVLRLEAVHTAGAPSEVEGVAGLLRRAFRSWKLDRQDLYDYLRDDLSHSPSSVEFSDVDARALTEWLMPQSSDDGEAGGLRFRFSSARQRHALLHRLLRRMSTVRPTFVWLDDLQWGSEALDTLEYFFATNAPAPASLVVATVRADVLAEQPDLARRIDEMVAQPACQRIDLAAIPPEDHRELLSQMLSLEDEFVDLLARRTEGNPLFATQLLRHLIDRGCVESGHHGFRLVDDADQPLPEDIFELWVGRINRLVASFPAAIQQDVRLAVEIAAALGKQVDALEWKLAGDERGLELSTSLAGRLIARGLARETPNGLEFTHGLLVDSLREQAQMAGRWEDHHRCCAQALEIVSLRTRRSTARRQADHWSIAGEYERAIDALDVAIKLARTGGDLKGGWAMVEQRKTLMDCLGWRKDHLRYLQNDARRAGYLIDLFSKTDDAYQLAIRVRDDAERVGSDEALARVLDALVRIVEARGQPEEALVLAEEAVQAARRSGNLSQLGLAHSRLAWTLFSIPDLQAAEENFREGIRCGQAAGDIYRNLYDRAGLINIAVQRGQFDLAIAQSEEVLKTVRKEGFSTIEDNLVNALGSAAKYTGDYETALESYRSSEQLAITLDEPRRLANALFSQATVYAAAGDVEAAEFRLSRFQDCAPSTGFGYLSATVDLVRLVNAASGADDHSFDSIISRFDEGWPDGQFLFRDAAWLAEIAARFCHNREDMDRARRARDLARDLYRRLEDEESVARLDL